MNHRIISREAFFTFCRLRRLARLRPSATYKTSLVEALEPRIAPASVATVTATLADSLAIDLDGDGVADPGDTIHYTEVISNKGGADVLQVQITHFLDANTSIVPGSMNVSPLAGDDSFNAVGNTKLEVGLNSDDLGVHVLGNLFANDHEFRNDLGVADFFELRSADTTSANGGTVLVNSDGAFTYRPAVGFVGKDTFTYTIADDGIDGIAGNADDLTGTGTVTINVSNRVWYVDSAATAGGDGRSDSPFNSIAQFSGPGRPDAAGDIIYIKSAPSNYVGNIALLNNEQLIGSGVALNVDGFQIAAAGSFTKLSYPGGTVINLGQGNTIRGFDIGNSEVDISGTVVGSLTMDHMGATGSGTALKITGGGTLDVSFDVMIVNGASDSALSLTGTSGQFVANCVHVSGVNGDAIVVSGGSVDLSINGSISKNSAGALINISGGHTGIAVFDIGALDATSGSGLQFNNADGNYQFNSLTKLHGGDAGIDILNGSSGSFYFSSSTSINKPAGIAFDLRDSNANVLYDGSITHDANSLISIDNHDGGQIVFRSGTLSHAPGGAGAGIVIQHSNGGSVSFDNSLIVLNTGIADGIKLVGNTGAEITFAAKQLDIDTTTGTGFLADQGGTVNVTGANNSIDATNGIALSFTNKTVIGASSLIFKSISAANALNGIVLDGTGNYGLTVTGDGTNAMNGSGGTIRATGTEGIKLINANNVVIRSMNLTDTGGDALFSSGGGNISVAGLQITNPGGHGWNASFLGGQSSMSNSLVTGFNGAGKNGINLSSSFASFTVTGSTFSNSATGGDGISVRFGKSGDATVAITNSTFTGIDQQGVEISNNGAATLTAIVQGNTFTAADTTGGDGDNTLRLTQAGTGQLNFTIDGNTFSQVGGLDANAGVIQVQAVGPGSAGAKLNGVIQNNTITDSMGRRGIMVLAEASKGSQGGHVISILGNTINAVGHEGIYAGFFALNGAHNDSNHLTISNNLVGNTTPVGGAGSFEALKVDTAHDGWGGSISADVLIQGNTFRNNNASASAETAEIVNDAFTGSTILNVTVIGNTFTNDNSSGQTFEVNSFDANSVTSLDLNAANTQPNSANRGFNLNQFAGTFSIEGMSPGSHTSAEVNAFLGARNTGSVAANGTFEGIGSVPLPLIVAPHFQIPQLTGEAVSPATAPAPGSTTTPENTVPVQSPAEPSIPASTTPAEPVDDGYLTSEELQALVDAAIIRWSSAGLDEAQMSLLESVTFQVDNLSGWNLGSADGMVITLDVNAAGLGWFVDSTPSDDVEFSTVIAGTHLSADSGLAAGRVDALTTVMHELGHVLGLDDGYLSGCRDSLMYGYVGLGERRLPAMGEALGAVVGAAGQGPDFAFLPYVLEAPLPAGKSVTVAFDAVIANPTVPNTANSVSAYAEISGSNFDTVTTDDPGTPDAGDHTVTAVPKADLAITKTIDKPRPHFGESVQFTVTVENSGSDTALNVVVKDLLPKGFSFVSATPSSGTYESSTGIWNIGAEGVGAGGSVSLTIIANVVAGGNQVTTAEVIGCTTYDLDSTPNDQAGDDFTSLTIRPDTGVFVVAAGHGSVPIVEVFDPATNQTKFAFLAYSSFFHGGVTVATGDVNGDGVLDIITAHASGAKGAVKVFDGLNGDLLTSFDAGKGSHGRVNISAGDVNNDGFDDVVVGIGRGSKAKVKIFSGADNSLLSHFTPYGHSPGGVRVATGDINGDGYADIITAVGNGKGAALKIFSGQTGENIGKIVAFGGRSHDVSLATADVNGDGQLDIIAASGRAGGSRAKIFDGVTFAQLGAIDLDFRDVRVSGVDFDGDNKAEVICAAGPRGDSTVTIFEADGTPVAHFKPFPPDPRGGIFVAAGDSAVTSKIALVTAVS